MTIDQLGLYNGALRLCQERKLASLSENREPKRLLDDVWNEDPIRNWLEASQWQFAARSYKLDYDPDVTPQFGYRRAFKAPDDFVRLLAISADEYFNQAMTAFKYETGYWFADLDIIYVSIVSDDADYGRDMSNWPPSFVRFAQADLAVQINPRLTTSRADTDDLKKELEDCLKSATGKDGVNRNTEFWSRGTWSRARNGFWGGRGGYNGGSGR